MEPTDHEDDVVLVRRALEHKEFFGAIITRYEAPLSRYIRRLGAKDQEDVYDILQETFIKVYRNLNEFDTTLKFSSWIYRIAHNETISWFRKRNVRPEGHLIENGDEVLSFIESPEWSSEDNFTATTNKAVLESALATLDDKYRDVVVLRFFEHKEYDEISDILKIPIGSVGTLLHRAKKQLRETLKDNKTIT